MSASSIRHATQFGPVDILVNNAAVTFLAPVEEFSEKRFRLMVELQMWAPYHLTQLVLPTMYERGAGWILNISSRGGDKCRGTSLRRDPDPRILRLRHVQSGP